MSAIWGAINIHGDNIRTEDCEVLRTAYHDCVIDRIEEIKVNNVYMGCGIQYFTKESRLEELPSYSESTGIYFNADVILDNREELIDKLDKVCEEKPDGLILNDIINRYSLRCLPQILGAFSFVFYDVNSEQINLVVDAVGNRCLYYCLVDGILYYSTLMKPLIELSRESVINDSWITDFLAMDHLLMFQELEETPIKNIFRVAPAQVVTVYKDKIERKSFWNPENSLRKIQSLTDCEYKEQFIRVFGKAIQSSIRADSEISILLSGGLDSTSVACFAARELEKKDKKLYSYTSVPVQEYVRKDNLMRVEDESGAVEITKKYLSNLDCTFFDYKDINIWDIRHQEVKELELPYKSIQNLIWIKEALKAAYSKGSRVMLTGSYGNNTISFSRFEIYMADLLSKGKFVLMWRELKAFQALYHYSRKTELKEIFIRFLTNRRKKSDKQSILNKSFVNRLLYMKSGSAKRLVRMEKEVNTLFRSYDDFRLMMCNKRLFRQIGEIQTKYSLYTGVIQRDPTMDKRVIEFCMNIPIEQYMRDGKERRLVTEYLSDYVPLEIIKNKRRGIQSADLKFRIHKDWERFRNELIDIYNQNKGSIYVDCERAISDLKDSSSIEMYNNFDIIRHAYTAMTLEYIQNIKC